MKRFFVLVLACHSFSFLTVLATIHAGSTTPFSSSLSSNISNTSDNAPVILTFTRRSSEASYDDDDDDDCQPDECRNQAIACHQQSIRACQVVGRRHDSCREKFARRCHFAYVQCQRRCQAAAGPDLDDGKVLPFPPGFLDGPDT
ncbi:hypothetical protein BGZ98_009617 [Dissophora globulifera]|nr:hypothetical protein BGZ98_009617 [Dissophora globulifera]